MEKRIIVNEPNWGSFEYVLLTGKVRKNDSIVATVELNLCETMYDYGTEYRRYSYCVWVNDGINNLYSYHDTLVSAEAQMFSAISMVMRLTDTDDYIIETDDYIEVHNNLEGVNRYEKNQGTAC